MKVKNLMSISLKLITLFLTVFGPGVVFAAETDEQISHTKSGPDLDVWEIRRPNVKQPITRYKSIIFRSGDQIAIEAGGGVQTGGKGKTWKLYVNPQGPNSDKLYHGLIHIPRGLNGDYPKSPTVKQLDMVRIQDVLKGGKKLKYQDFKDDSFEPGHLVLGYEDDGYSDNGYLGHDDGTGNQTKGVGPAWVRITIEHKKP
jgi:hypothetical protein